MTPLILILILAFGGALEAAYLVEKRFKSEKPVCPIGDDCSKVLESKYNHIFYVHNDIAGLLSHLAIFAISGLLILNNWKPELLTILLKVIITFSSVISAVLVYIQWKIIKSWCFWCWVSAIIVWLMAIILIFSKI